MPNQLLPCILNGHTPPELTDEVEYNITEGNCIYCGCLMYHRKMWGGMKWKYWWATIEI